MASAASGRSGTGTPVQTGVKSNARRASPSTRSGSDLTAIVFAVSDSPGALHEVLKQFAERGVNLTKIQSRPTPSDTWQYLFFIEVQGHATDRPIVGAIEEVRRHSKFFKVLGSYTST